MESRKNQIISLAFKLIQEKGFVAMSYDDLSKPLGVTKASIHYHLSSLQADFESLPETLQHKVKEVSEKELFILIQILKTIQEEGGIDSAAEIEPLTIMILAGGKGILQYQRVFGRKLAPSFFQTNQSAYSIARP
jgi:TetR/AcrR family transcriptional regulator, transcriptional repressor for nem operon